MKVLQNTPLWKIALIILMLGMLTNCTSFERHNPSPVGIFYPNQPIQGVSFMKDDFFHSENRISFSHPVKIKSVGIMTWNSLTGEKSEVALLESPQLDHLNGDFYINTDGDYYANITWLKTKGRIEYTGNKTSGDYFWESGWGTLIKILILVILGYLGFRTIKKYFKAEKRKRVLEKNQKQEEDERKIKEAQIKKENEIQRRKDIVLDIINNLYKETESEIGNTPISMPTLIDELYDIFNKLHSENLNDLIINGSLTDYQNIINSIKSELNRLKKLALDAQLKR
jgi:hypothetical protein